MSFVTFWLVGFIYRQGVVDQVNESRAKILARRRERNEDPQEPVVKCSSVGFSDSRLFVFVCP